MLDMFTSLSFWLGVAFGYLLLGQLIGLLMGIVGGFTGKGGASPTGYPVNEGHY